MALKKTYSTNSGASGNYHVITSLRWEPEGAQRQASATISLYVDKAARDAGKAALVPIIGRFIVCGPSFDACLGKRALKEAEHDIVGQLYTALRAASSLVHSTGERDKSRFFASDCGPDFYHDAEDI